MGWKARQHWWSSTFAAVWTFVKYNLVGTSGMAIVHMYFGRMVPPNSPNSPNSPKLLHAQGVSKCMRLICCHVLIDAPENLPNLEHFPHWWQLLFIAIKSTKALKNTKNLSSQYIRFYHHSLIILFSFMLQTYLFDSRNPQKQVLVLSWHYNWHTVWRGGCSAVPHKALHGAVIQGRAPARAA